MLKVCLNLVYSLIIERPLVFFCVYCIAQSGSNLKKFEKILV